MTTQNGKKEGDIYGAAGEETQQHVMTDEILEQGRGRRATFHQEGGIQRRHRQKGEGQ